MTEPLRWDEGGLLILDQRRLPCRGDLAALRDARSRWPRRSAALAVRGAPAIGLAAAYGMALATERERGGASGSTRPTAVNLAWAMDALAGLARRRSSFAPRAPRGAARRRPAPGRRSARSASPRATARSRTATPARSPPAASAPRAACSRPPGSAAGWRRCGWTRRARCCRAPGSRPGSSSGPGIPYRVVTDASAGALMARGLVDRVVVGADRIAANGDVANKIGTYPLAVLAAPPRGALLRGGAAVHDRPGHGHGRGHPDRGARPGRGAGEAPAGAQPRLRRDPGRARRARSSPRPACSSPLRATSIAAARRGR